MFCNYWWSKADGAFVGTAGPDWVFGGRNGDLILTLGGNDVVFAGRGDDFVDGGAGNDWIWGGSGSNALFGGAGHDLVFGGWQTDVVDGGSGSDRVYGGYGDDIGVYDVSENRGFKDYYDGGGGKNDVLILRMAYTDFLSSEVQADLEAFDAFLEQPGGYHCWWYQPSFKFEAFDLKVSGWESYVVEFTDPPPPSNMAPVAVDDAVVADLQWLPIEEVESNDPADQDRFAAAQVIARSSFVVAPNVNVGNDTMPTVAITGEISQILSDGRDPQALPGSDVDVYALTLQGGEKLVLDIDHGYDVMVPGHTLWTTLSVMDADGTLLAQSGMFSNPGQGGLGSTDQRDAYLEFQAPDTGGTYYVAVSSFPNIPNASGEFPGIGASFGTYHLNVSVDNAAPELGAVVIPAADLLANDTDADGDALTITGVGNAVNGSVALADNGDVLFKPLSGDPASFEYTIDDGNGGVSTARVAVNGEIVDGTDGPDALVSTTANELFFGGAESDTFSFSPGSGQNTVADYELGVDMLVATDGLNPIGVVEQGDATKVTFDTDDSVLLVGVTGVDDVNDLFA